MSLRLTDPNAVVIYGSASGNPVIGLPTFDSEDHAQDFIEFCEAATARGYGALESLLPSAVGRLYDEWRGKRLDEDGYLRETVVGPGS